MPVLDFQFFVFVRVRDLYADDVHESSIRLRDPSLMVSSLFFSLTPAPSLHGLLPVWGAGETINSHYKQRCNGARFGRKTHIEYDIAKVIPITPGLSGSRFDITGTLFRLYKIRTRR